MFAQRPHYSSFFIFITYKSCIPVCRSWVKLGANTCFIEADRVLCRGSPIKVTLTLTMSALNRVTKKMTPTSSKYSTVPEDSM